MKVVHCLIKFPILSISYNVESSSITLEGLSYDTLHAKVTEEKQKALDLIAYKLPAGCFGVMLLALYKSVKVNQKAEFLFSGK